MLRCAGQQHLAARQAGRPGRHLPGQFPVADPDSGHPGPPERAQRGQEVVRRLLVGQPADRADHRGVRGQAQFGAGPAAPGRGRRRPGGGLVGTVRDHPDGAHPLRGDQPAADRLDGHPGAHAQGHVGDPAEAAFMWM